MIIDTIVHNKIVNVKKTRIVKVKRNKETKLLEELACKESIIKSLMIYLDVIGHDSKAIIKRLTQEIKKDKKHRAPADEFYKSRAWIKLRYDTLVKFNGRCQCCGATKSDGVNIQVDHIKPKSKFPHLALDPENVQVLCKDCNVGKFNTDFTDWRDV